jgi:hypothetical protein
MKRSGSFATSVECMEFTSNLFYDIARNIGKADSRNFRYLSAFVNPVDEIKLSLLHRSVIGLDANVFNLAAGFIAFACAGWAFVDVLSESRVSERDENFSVVCLLPFSFEAEAWLKHKGGHKLTPIPVCAMSAGYLRYWNLWR